MKHFNLPFNLGRLVFAHDKGVALIRANQMFATRLTVNKIIDGEIIASYDLGSGVITQVGVNRLAADWSNTTGILKLIKWMDSGSGANVATINDTVLQTPTGAGRIAGAQSNINNVLTVTGTLTYSGPFTITEWGLFTASVGGTLWDRRNFTGIAVVNGVQLQFVYSLTLLAGG